MQKYITSKHNYPGSVLSYNTQPGNKIGLYNNAPKPTQGSILREEMH